MKKTKLIVILLTLAILFGQNVLLSEPTSAAGPVTVVVDGKTVLFPDAQPFTDENRRTMVPVRFVSVELGCDVQYFDEIKTVALYRGLIKVELTVEQKEITILGAKKAMDTVAIIQENRTFVPVRFVAEAFGCEVEWEHATRTVIITSPDNDIYKIGDFAIEIDESDKFSTNTAGGLVVVKESGLIIGEGKYNGKSVLRITIIVDDPAGDILKQRLEAETLLRKRLNTNVVENVMAHAKRLQTFSDDLEIESWTDKGYDISAGGGRGVISIMVYMP